jgi:hypothetical protein
MSVPEHPSDSGSWDLGEDLLGELDGFICSTRLVVQEVAGRVWLKVWPGVGFCVHPENRTLLPAGTSFRSPLRPEQAWSAFTQSKGGDHGTYSRLNPRPFAVTVADLIDPWDYLWDDVPPNFYETAGDRQAQAEAILFAHLSASLQELNSRIVKALGIEGWDEPVKRLLRDVGLADGLNLDDHDRLISAMSGRWGQISPYVDATMAAEACTSGPAMLYLVAMCSACAVSLEQGDTPSLRAVGLNWAGSLFDRTQPDPHVRLLRAISELGHRKSVVRVAARIGGQRVRILSENCALQAAFSHCLEGLAALREVGEAIPPAFLADIEFSRTRWRKWPNKVLRLAVSQAATIQGTFAYEKLLTEELSCVEDAVENHRLSPDRLPPNIRWRGLVSAAADLIAINLSWESALPAYCDHGFEVAPLLSSAALRYEGAKMKNCVASYDVPCETGISQIYSIRDCRTGQQVATANIRGDSNEQKWRLAQVKGPCNHSVSLLIEEIAGRIARLYELNESYVRS